VLKESKAVRWLQLGLMGLLLAGWDNRMLDLCLVYC